MKLEKEPYYNPFALTVGGISHYVDAISAFDNENGKIVAEINCGWFGNNNSFRDGLELPCDCVRKNKVDLKCKTAFVVVVKDDILRETKWHLYIPADVLGVNEPTYRKTYCPMVCETITTNIQGVVFEKHICVSHLLGRLDDEISDIADKIKYCRNSKKLANYVAKLTEVVAWREAEEKRIAETDAKILVDEALGKL